jgi:hypothetical protein
VLPLKEKAYLELEPRVETLLILYTAGEGLTNAVAKKVGSGRGCCSLQKLEFLGNNNNREELYSTF